jgi:parallel beta-helix repeat protein
MSSFTGETKTTSTCETKTSPTTPPLEWVRLDQSNEFSLTNSCLPWKYPHPNDTRHIVVLTSITSSMILLQPELIPKEYKKIQGITRRSFTGGTKNLWLRVYSYLQPSYFTRVRMKCSCRLFNDVEKMITFNPKCSPLEPIPLFTSFPHPNYPSLRGLMTCLNALSKKEPDNVPSLLLIADGVHTIENYKSKISWELWEGDVNYLVIDFPITIIGESKEGCTIIGGLRMKGKKEDDVNVKHLTISQSKWFGVCGYGMSFHLFNLNIEKSERIGVYVDSTKRNTMSNCQVSHSKESGVSVLNSGLITMTGSGTSVHNNVTGGRSSQYGLHTYGSSSSFHLVSPLKKENISKHNGGGGNCGGDGTIATVDNEGALIKTIQEAEEDDN